MNGTNAEKWEPDAIDGYDTSNVTFMTYQSLAKKSEFFRFPSLSIVVFDENQYLLNDSTFSSDTMIVRNIIKNNLKQTKRIYISATINEVIDEICRIEGNSISPADHIGYSETENFSIAQNCTDIYQVILSEENWENLNFKFYSYSDIDGLAGFISRQSEQNKKTVVFIRNQKRGEQLKDKLINDEFVFSSDEESDIINEIERSSEFSCCTLISTKVLENGVSITDLAVDTIVIDEIDPISFKQFLGRIRINRANPRSITVIIPDYSIGELSSVKYNINNCIALIQDVKNYPERCINSDKYSPYVYYSEISKSIVPNYLAEIKLNHIKDFLDELIEEEKTAPHAYIRSVLRMLNLSEDIEDSQFLNHDDINAFKSGIRDAYNVFTASRQLKSDRNELAKALINVVETTNFYNKKITGSQLQIDKINDILACAGIEEKIRSLGEAFEVYRPESE